MLNIIINMKGHSLMQINSFFQENKVFLIKTDLFSLWNINQINISKNWEKVLAKNFCNTRSDFNFYLITTIFFLYMFLIKTILLWIVVFSLKSSLQNLCWAIGFFCFGPKIPFWVNLVENNQNCLRWNLASRLTSIVTFTVSVLG